MTPNWQQWKAGIAKLREMATRDKTRVEFWSRFAVECAGVLLLATGLWWLSPACALIATGATITAASVLRNLPRKRGKRDA